MRMRTVVGLLLLPIGLACGGAADVGGAAPVVAEAPAAEARNLAFSNWKIEWIGEGIVNEFDFLPDGKFIDPKWPDNVNTYRIDGNKIHMEYNSSYVIYEGEFVNDYKMGGTLVNGKGMKANWRGVQLAE